MATIWPCHSVLAGNAGVRKKSPWDTYFIAVPRFETGEKTIVDSHVAEPYTRVSPSYLTVFCRPAIIRLARG